MQTKSPNITWQESHVSPAQRVELLGQRGCTIWFTGLPASGKSTTAYSLEHELLQRRFLATVLDGDNVRHGLNKDLGFSAEDREENIRRVGEVARLFSDAGLITMTSFISPYRKDRDRARQIHAAAGISFFEVFVDTPLHICEQRDPKGLYRKARSGQLKGLTGVDDPYEPPLQPELVVRTSERSPTQIVEDLVAFLAKEKVLLSDRRH